MWRRGAQECDTKSTMYVSIASAPTAVNAVLRRRDPAATARPSAPKHQATATRCRARAATVRVAGQAAPAGAKA